jgi:hypothetical protein
MRHAIARGSPVLRRKHVGITASHSSARFSGIRSHLTNGPSVSGRSASVIANLFANLRKVE